MRKLIPLLLGLLLWGGVQATAQEPDVCTPRVEGALAGTQTRCTDLPDQGICYGNAPAELVFARSVEDASFSNPGDIVGLSLVDTLTLRAFNSEANEWGVARANVRLNFTDETLIMWLFGGMTLENQGDVAANVPAVMLRVASNQGANVRSAPAADAPLVSVVYTGAEIRATGRLADRSWIRVQTDEGASGWVTAGVFTGEGFDALIPVEGGVAPAFGSLQAFRLETSAYDRASCRALPPPGLLIQSPAAEQTARLRVNDILVDVTPESTVFLSAAPTETLRVDVLEGAASVTTEETSIPIAEGTGVQLDEGTEAAPRPYDYNALAQLPVNRLPRPIFVALDFDTLVRPALQDVDPLAGLGAEDDCTIAAITEAANLREAPRPDARVRRVLQVGESAAPDGRVQGSDGALWWRLAVDVWVSSNAVGALGDCGTLPVLPPR